MSGALPDDSVQMNAWTPVCGDGWTETSSHSRLRSELKSKTKRYAFPISANARQALATKTRDVPVRHLSLKYTDSLRYRHAPSQPGPTRAFLVLVWACILRLPYQLIHRVTPSSLKSGDSRRQLFVSESVKDPTA